MEDFDEYPLLHRADLMTVLLKSASAGSASLDEAMERLREALNRAHENPPVPAADIRRRLELAKGHLLQARLLDDLPGGRFRLTQRGRIALQQHPEGVDDSVLMRFPEFQDYVRRIAAHAPPEDADTRTYQQGFSAYHAGKSYAENPHRFETGAHLSWENGWFDARDEERKNRRR